jgi:hypothetical protein
LSLLLVAFFDGKGRARLLELSVYTLFLLVVMPLLLLGAGKLVKYCTQNKPGWIGFPSEKPVTTVIKDERN